ncbi:adenine phosphoribosyltransferase 1-like [Platysternon megacephalum]|uniref:Adenine phosphoribosyltransferase 1-like n=1 Tax=Platysternon megacephalum TaxID=55544 RepID=A0A4D9DX88_9SAUR|nr:adenine phosphoribosyltransferase 1-like [Platysternon megacephalum]
MEVVLLRLLGDRGGGDVEVRAEQGVARMGLPALAVATLLGLVAATLAEVAENRTRLCQPAPRWEINGTAPMTGALGQVTVVALLKAS